MSARTTKKTTAAPAVKPQADPRDAQIAELQAALAAATASAPAAAVDHVSDDRLASAKPGQLVRFTTAPADGSDAVEGYGLVVDVATVDDATGGEPVKGEPTRSEVLIAPLGATHNRVPAAQVLELLG